MRSTRVWPRLAVSHTHESVHATRTGVLRRHRPGWARASAVAAAAPVFMRSTRVWPRLAVSHTHESVHATRTGVLRRHRPTGACFGHGGGATGTGHNALDAFGRHTLGVHGEDAAVLRPHRPPTGV